MSRSLSALSWGVIALSSAFCTEVRADDAWAGGGLRLLGAPRGLEATSVRPRLRSQRFVAGPRLSTEVEMNRALLRSSQRGGGGDLLDFQALQIAYGDPVNGNVVLLLWTESIANPDNISVLLDGIPLGALPPVPANQVPALNGVNITNVTPGPHTFRIETGSANAEVSQVVVDAQPFADVSNLKCEEMGPRDPVTGNCRMLISWEVTGTEPSRFGILINDILQGELPGTQREITFLGVPPGSYTVNVIGILENSDGQYRGGAPESTCDLVCAEQPCESPADLLLCQVSYSEGAENMVLAGWTNGELLYAGGVIAFTDGETAGTLPGDAETATFLLLSPGDHTLGVQGDCGEGVTSERVEETINVRSATPYTNPVNGPILCTFNAETEETTATWTNADPAILIAVFADTPATDPVLLDFIPGDSTFVTYTNSTSDTTLSFQFFAIIDGDCYASNEIACTVETGGKKYIQGVCNGVGDTPQITSAIFGLNFLFAGGPQPPCRKACDVDGNGGVDLTDMVRILNYLFSGGPPPTLWVDSNGDQKPDPTCTTAAPEDNCETPHEACAV